MKLRNVTGYPLVIRKYAVTVGPGGVIDTDELAGYDPATDGAITGFESVEDDPTPAKKAPAKTDGKDSKETGK